MRAERCAPFPTAASPKRGAKRASHASLLPPHRFSAPGQVSPTAHFTKDLGLDSLDAVEVVMALEEEFAIEIPDAEADKILSVDDAVTYIAAHPHAK